MPLHQQFFYQPSEALKPLFLYILHSMQFRFLLHLVINLLLFHYNMLHYLHQTFVQFVHLIFLIFQELKIYLLCVLQNNPRLRSMINLDYNFHYLNLFLFHHLLCLYQMQLVILQRLAFHLFQEPQMVHQQPFLDKQKP